MRTWHLFDPSTGMFNGQRYSSSAMDSIDINRGDMGAIEGVIDPRSQRVDLATGEVIDYQPPAPDADHEWIHDDEHGNRVRRWVLKPEVAARGAKRRAALEQLASLDGKQIRALGELAVNPDDAAAKQRLADILKQKELLRADL